MISNERLRYVRVAAQILTVFLSFSILLGRIYYIEYHNTLGIPSSRSPLNLLDYSIIAPDVSIVSFGVSLIFAMYVFRLEWLNSMIENVRFKIIVALVFVTLYAATLVVSTLLYSLLGSFIPGFYGTSLTVAIAFAMIAHVAWVGGISEWLKRRRERKKSNALGKCDDEIGPNQEKLDSKTADSSTPRNIWTSWESSLYLLPVIILISGFIFQLALTATIANLDAANRYKRAPVAEVWFTNTEFFDEDRFASLECADESVSCRAGVVHFDGEFLYLRPVKTEINKDHNRMYVIGMDKVAGLSYIDASDFND